MAECLSGKQEGCVVILHGGAGPQDPSKEGIERATMALKKIASKAIKMCLKEHDLIQVVQYCLEQLEKDPQFNAGIGSALQSDGLPRLSASIMDGKRQRFSGVVSASYISYPSKLVVQLQKRRARVLTNPGTELLAREMGLPINSNLTEKRSKKWLRTLQNEDYQPYASDTVGCVIIDKKGRMIAGSSTGGRGFEYPGRVSDTATVAGNYASQHAAIAVTGHGEQIVDDAVAARIDTRIRDGMSLIDACTKMFHEAKKMKHKYGWIVLDRHSNWGVYHTTDNMPYVVYGEKGVINHS